MKQLAFVLWTLLLASTAFSQNTNVAFRSKMTFSGQTVANVWGYAANGREYALIGASKGLVIADITNPDEPVQIVQIPGPNSLWKEIRTYRHYAYVVTEGGGGVQIVNLSKLPSANLDYHSYVGDGAIQGQLGKIHALHIDETKGFLYAFGGNLFNGGAKVLDLNVDPYNPTYAGKFDQLAYIHDGYVDNDTMYSGHIYQGKFAIVDMTDKSAPNLIASQNTPNNFTHNTWLTDDRKTLLTTDETANSFLTAFDVSDPGNITLLDKVQSNPGSGSAVHNTIVLGNHAITAWYKDGFTIVDISRPDNLVQVGNYDTYPNGSGSGFEGCWGAYPYFPSGTIIASTMAAPGNIGELWVLTPTYVRACYLEGNITNGLTGNPLSGVTISVQGSEQTTTLPNGTFKMGQERQGYFTVLINKAGFQSQEYIVHFQRGDVRVLNISLYPTGGIIVDGQVLSGTNGAPVPNATVVFLSSPDAFETTTASDGTFQFENLLPGLYDIAAEASGYGQTIQYKQKITADKTVMLALPAEIKAVRGPLRAVAERSGPDGKTMTVQAWPNPFAGEFSVTFPEHSASCRIEVADQTGRLIEQLDVSEGENSFRMGSKWDAGIYLIRVWFTDGKFEQMEVVKAR
ncbi:MAG: choice-of-anchor B family protein [Saprospiraceae bacterium]